MNTRQPKPVQAKGVHTTETSVHMVSAHKGPLPSAQEFALYEKTSPGAADTILRMAESEQKHRHETESAIIDTEIEEARATHKENILAYWLAFFVVMTFLAAGFTLTFYGHDWVGGIMMGTSMVGVIGSFLKKSKS